MNAIELLQKRYQEKDFAVSVLAEYTQVEDYLNTADKNIFDIILLDRDCHACGSFHCLDFSKYPVEKIIAISSVPSYNEEVKKLGVSRVVHKDFQNMEVFIHGVIQHIEEMVENND